MKTLIFSISKKEGSIKISMEVNAETEGINHSHCKHSYVCLDNRIMENLNVNLTKATNYLVQLFYKTNQRYTCTRTKVGKLLSIVAFVYARQNKLAFNEIIHKYDECGTAIYEIMERFKDSDIYTRSVYEDDANKVPDIVIASSSNSRIVIPKEYEDISGLDIDVIATIDSVFKMFGAYSPSSLGECINPIVNYTDVINSENEIVLEKIADLNINCFSNANNQALIKYLFEF